MSEPATIERVYLQDYRPPDFLITSVNLDFELAPDTTLVRSVLSVSRNSSDIQALRLDGEDLELLAVRINGQALAQESYTLAEHSLTIHDVPDRFQLEIENRIKEVGREPLHEEFEALTHFVRERVAALSAMDLYRARQGAHEASIRLMNSMSELDLVLTPALGSDPIPVGYMDSRTADFNMDTWGQKGHAFAPFAYICNVSGQPAASLPIQLNAGEHPCAVQLAGHTGKDHLILQVAAELERELQWHGYRPPVWAGNL